MELYNYTITEIQDKLKSNEISVTDVTKSVLKRIEKSDSKVKAYIEVTGEKALQAAKEIDDEIHSEKKLSPLAGIPMAIKDNMCIDGIKTTCGSKILENFVSPYNATVIEKLNAQKAILLGKLNMDEFAMGSSTENSAFFKTCNPWDLKKVPGGSSGGSAASVASDEAFFALGSDTGGSIRQPASFCGVVGLKPTYGRVSRYGLVAYASSLDQIGPITKSVEDAAIVLETIAGQDPFDSTSANIPVDNYRKNLKEGIKGLKVGIPKEYFPDELNPQVKDVVMKAAADLESMGALVEECSLPHTEHALTAYYIIAPAEASSNLARFDGVRYGYRTPVADDLLTMYRKTRQEGFGTEVKRRIIMGTYVLSSGYYDAYYLRALKVRTLVKNDLNKAFQKYDCLLTPTSPTVAFNLGEKINDPLSMYLADLFTIPANMAGIPAISVPCGFSNGLPVGLQLMGKPFDESTILKAAYAYEQNNSWYKSKPSIED
ncbi:MAG: glutamyl-tRNA amidotransferase [Desulfitibacter sp. BRH_c19]|nr:MAG: glutamyl-tRNA amidotransferase [Desulfitibacter sp. BRH_c19]